MMWDLTCKRNGKSTFTRSFLYLKCYSIGVFLFQNICWVIDDRLPPLISRRSELYLGFLSSVVTFLFLRKYSPKVFPSVGRNYSPRSRVGKFSDIP